MSAHASAEADVPLPLPSALSQRLTRDITIQPPLSRLGRGPGLVLFVDSTIDTGTPSESLDPPPLQKWAEEGYAVAQIDISRSSTAYEQTLKVAISALKEVSQYDGNPRFGLIS